MKLAEFHMNRRFREAWEVPFYMGRPENYIDETPPPVWEADFHMKTRADYMAESRGEETGRREDGTILRRDAT